jgi:hypothetical protein
MCQKTGRSRIYRAVLPSSLHLSTGGGHIIFPALFVLRADFLLRQ